MQRRLSEEEKKQICERYISGENGTTLAKVFNISAVSISNTLKKNNISARTQSEAQKTRICKIEKGVTYTCDVCGKLFKDKPSRKRRYCSKACWEIRNPKVLMGCAHCGKEFKRYAFDVNKKYCNKKCHNASMERRILLKCQCCGKEYEERLSHAVEGRGKYCGIECAGKMRSGSNNGSWKGGRHMGGLGYIFVHAPDHPYRNSDNQVYEHRLVMEKVIGRLLEPQEVVHHINKNKTDNRPENLVLFSNNGEHITHHLNIRWEKRKDGNK